VKPDEILAKIHTDYREQCKRLGTYVGVNPVDTAREIERWNAECNRPPRVSLKRVKKPKGEAD